MFRLLDKSLFFPEVYQAVAGENYKVYAYMNDGSMRLYNVKPLIDGGGVFESLRNKQTFKDTLTVLNGTIAWDLEGTRDESKCIDIDPFDVYETGVIVPDIPF